MNKVEVFISAALSVSLSYGPGFACGLPGPRVGGDSKAADGNNNKKSLGDLLKPPADMDAKLKEMLKKAGINVPASAALDASEASYHGHGHRMVNPPSYTHTHVHHGSAVVDPLLNLTETWFNTAWYARGRIAGINGEDPCAEYEDYGEFQYTFAFDIGGAVALNAAQTQVRNPAAYTTPGCSECGC